MMTVRNAQLEALRSIADDAFIAELLPELVETYPVLAERSPAERVAMLKVGLSRARAHGLRSKTSLRGWLDLMCGVAPNFDEHPAFASILADASVPLGEKMLALMSGVADEDFDEAEEQARESAWNEPEPNGSPKR